MKKVHIRQETSADFPAVYEILKLAFEQDTEARLVELLRNDNAFIPQLSLVAIVDDKIVGHILFTKIRIRNDDGRQYESLALAPMAVIPGLQKQGIGAQLINHGLTTASALGHQSVIVLGHEHYYPKFGFVEAARWSIKAPFEVPSNVFMAIELEKDALKGISGTVEYANAFMEV